MKEELVCQLHKRIPKEIIRMIILEFTPYHTQKVCQFVCKFWKNVVLADPDGVKKEPNDEFIYSACRHNDLHVLQWARNQGCPWTDPGNSLPVVAESGNLDMFKWIYENGNNVLTDEVIGCTAFSGKREMVLYLKDLEGFEWNANTKSVLCIGAATGGQIEMLEWLHDEYNCPYDENTVFAASMMNHLETLKWLREKGCPWKDSATESAILNGHIEIFKWLKANGCPIVEKDLVKAAIDCRSGNPLEMLNLLKSQNCIPQGVGEEIGKTITETDQPDIHKWFKDNGFLQ